MNDVMGICLLRKLVQGLQASLGAMSETNPHLEIFPYLEHPQHTTLLRVHSGLLGHRLAVVVLQSMDLEGG